MLLSHGESGAGKGGNWFGSGLRIATLVTTYLPGTDVDLECFLYPSWHPLIRAATKRRAWMDATPESFAYRCLPLSIANAHGWEIATPLGFSARWNGGSETGDVEIVLDDENATGVDVPVSLFGQATITFHIAGLFRTSSGWSLWVGGPANDAKDGIAPLSGVIETDWSPYTFTMNWRFTRPHHWVRFEPGEVIAFFFPVKRHDIDAIEPRYRPIDEAPDLKRQFEDWSRSRDAFQHRMLDEPPSLPADKWQKLYYRGVDPDDCPAAGHQAKLRVKDFGPPLPPLAAQPVSPKPCPANRPPDTDIHLAKRNWLLAMQEDLRALSPAGSEIYRYEDIDPAVFLDEHYAANRPAILAGEIADWPALTKWSPTYLADAIGDAPVEYQAGRRSNARFELDKDHHRQRRPFSQFMAEIMTPGAGNDSYLTAYNAGTNAAALSPLLADLGRLDKFLDHRTTGNSPGDEGLIWIGPAGTFTPLHHDLTNNLLVQLVGRKRVVLVPAAQAMLMRNDVHVFSEIGDILNPEQLKPYPEAHKIRLFDVLLNPGEALFIPVGWWHQVTAVDFSVSATYTNFRWRNDWYRDYPA